MPEAAAVAAQPTLRALLHDAARDLQRAGIEDAGNDARRLLATVLGLSAAQMLSQPERRLDADEARRFGRAIARRSRREPVSRIIGARDFYGRSFAVSPATLDPRPDSETLIEAALELAGREGWLARPIRILDVGTGSGCLLTTLLCELPDAVGVGTDVSEDALKVARRNAQALGVDVRAQWLARDMLDGIEGRFDILVSNVPYLPSGIIAGLEPEVRCHDPWSALDGGDDGLRFFRRIGPRIRAVIPDGWAILEVGHQQAEAVAALLASHGVGIAPGDLELKQDVMRIRRCVAGRTRG